MSKSRDKGARGELALRDLLSFTWPYRNFIRCGDLQRKSDLGLADVEMGDADKSKITKLPFFAEVKYYRGSHKLGMGLRQAIRDTDGRTPVVFTKDTDKGDQEGWFVAMRYEDWVALVNGRLSLKPILSVRSRVRKKR